ncbi:MAG: thermostable hemolysin delta-VPH [Clostridia bacterium]|nr:thermostable hemolysin delta-VPH [Clostridia bacterium]
MYYNYHSKIKQLIKNGHFLSFEFFEKWNKVNNCYVLFFDNHKPMPVRDYRWQEYLEFFKENNIELFKNIDK